MTIPWLAVAALARLSMGVSTMPGRADATMFPAAVGKV